MMLKNAQPHHESYLHSHLQVCCCAAGLEAQPLLCGELLRSCTLGSWGQSGWFQLCLSAKPTGSALMRNTDCNFQSNRSWQIIEQWRDRGRRAKIQNAAAGNVESRHRWQLLNYTLQFSLQTLSLLPFSNDC